MINQSIGTFMYRTLFPQGLSNINAVTIISAKFFELSFPPTFIILNLYSRAHFPCQISLYILWWKNLEAFEVTCKSRAFIAWCCIMNLIFCVVQYSCERACYGDITFPFEVCLIWMISLQSFFLTSLVVLCFKNLHCITVRCFYYFVCLFLALG